MSRFSVVVVVGLLVTSACGPAATRKCTASACATGQRCDVATELCIKDELPVVVIDPHPAIATGLSLTATGKVTDDVGVASAEVSADGQAWAAFNPQADGAFSVAVTLPPRDVGQVTLAVRATDTAGQVGQASLPVIVDNVGPQVTLVSPSATVRGASVTVVLAAADHAGVARVTADFADGGAVAATAQGANWSVEQALPAGADLTELPFTATAEDLNGNVTATPLVVRFDNAGPAGSITTPDAGALLTGSGVTVTGTAADPSGVASVVVQFAGADAGVSATVVQGAWTVTLPLPTADGTAQSIEATLTDAVGNTTQLSLAVTVDDVAPVITFLEPAADALAGGPSGATVAARVTATKAASVALSVGAGAAAAAVAAPGDVWAGAPALPLEDYAPETLTAVARDAAGNQSQATRRIYVDRVAPVLTVASPTEGQKFNASAFTTSNGVAVAFSATDGDPQALAEASVDQVSWHATCVVSTSATDNPQSYSVLTRATDRAGNRSTLTRTFSVDRVPPTIVASSPAPGTRNLEPRQASVTFSEPVQGAAEALVLTPAAAGGAWSMAGAAYTTPVLPPYTAFGAAFAAGLADGYGNPLVAPAPFRFHTAAAIPANGAVLATAVWDFDVVSDPDGLALVALNDGLGNWRAVRMSVATGALETTNLAAFANVSPTFRAHLAAWNTVQPDLSGQRVVGAGMYRPAPPPPPFMVDSSWVTSQVGDAAPVVIGAPSGPEFLVPTPPIASQGVDGTGQVGFIWGTTYRRDPSVSVTLGGLPQRLGWSPSRWAGFRLSGTSLAWDEYACDRSFIYGVPPSCYVSPFSVTDNSGTSAESVSVAMAADGSCLVAAYDSPTGRRFMLQAAHTCGSFTCGPSTPGTFVGDPKARLAPFGAGAQVLEGSDNGSAFRLAWVAPGCVSVVVPIGSTPSTGAKFLPVQLGGHPALLYLDAARDLRVFVP